MPLQNRVTPGGELIATSARGTLMGNRGILHDDNKEIVRTSRNMMWLICRLEFKGRRRPLMSPRTYTELFFLDEAVALAAGHRPCGECRRSQYRSYMDAVNQGSEEPPDGPKDLDRRLNESRRAPWTMTALATLPDGVFVALGDDDFRLIWGGALHRWSPTGYVDAVAIDDIEWNPQKWWRPRCRWQRCNAAIRSKCTHQWCGASGSTSGWNGHVDGRHPPRFATSEMCSTNAVDELPDVADTRTAGRDQETPACYPVRHGRFSAPWNGGRQTRWTQAAAMRGTSGTVSKPCSPEHCRRPSRPPSSTLTVIATCLAVISPELRSHTTIFLRQLNAINPEVRINEPLQIRALPGTTARRRADNRPRR
jgi:hypothetical protein